MLLFIALLVATSTIVIGHPRAGHHNSRSRYLMRQPSCRTDVYRKTSHNSCVKVYEIFPVEIKVLKDNEELDEREIRHLIKKEIRSLQRLLQEFDPMPYSNSLIDDLIGWCCSYKRPETSSKYAKHIDDSESDSEDAIEDEEDESETFNKAEKFMSYTTVKQTELPSTNSTSNPVEKLNIETTVKDEKENTQSDSDATDTHTMMKETTSKPTEIPWATRLEPVDKTHRPLTTQVDEAFDPSTDESQYEGVPQDQTESDATSRRPKKHKHPQATQVDESQYEGVPQDQTESDAMSRRPKKHKHPQTTQVDESQYEGVPQDQTESDATSRRPKKHKHPQTTQVDESQYEGVPQDQTESDATSRRPKKHKHPQTTQVDESQYEGVPQDQTESDATSRRPKKHKHPQTTQVDESQYEGVPQDQTESDATSRRPKKHKHPQTTQVDESQYEGVPQDQTESDATSRRPKKHKHPQTTQVDESQYEGVPQDQIESDATSRRPKKHKHPQTTQVDESQYEGVPQDQTESDATSRRPKKHKHPQTTQVDDMDTTQHPTVRWFFPDSDSQYGDEVFGKINQKAYDRTNSNPAKHHKKKQQSQRDATRQKETKRHGNAKKLTKH